MRPILIGVAGGSGSGKTTVVREIIHGLGPDQVSVIHHDAYYRERPEVPAAARAGLNYDHPDALETPLLVRHLAELRAGRPVEVPVYDFTAHTRLPETVTVYPTRAVIVDGLLVLYEPELRGLLDIKIFVDTDADVRLIRRLLRDIRERGRSLDAVIQQYTATVRPMHQEFVEPSKRYADVIVPEGGHNRVAVDMLVTKIRAILSDA